MKQSTVKRRALSVFLLVAIVLTTLSGASASPAITPFTDVSQGHWAHDYVQFVHSNSIMIGTSETTFAPESAFSRAMTAATLFRTVRGRVANEMDSRQSPFTDVSENAWFAPYVSWVSAMGLVTDEDTFMPMTPASREFFAAMLHRLAIDTGFRVNVPESFDLEHFADHAEISPWALEAMRWANYNGIVRGISDTRLAPGGSSTRAQTATMLYRYLNDTFTIDDWQPRGLDITTCPSLYEPFPNAGHVMYLRTFGTNLISSQALVLRYVEYQRVSLDDAATMLEEFIEQNPDQAWVRPHIEESLELIRSGAANAYLFKFMLVDDVNGITYVQPCLRLYDARLESFYMEDIDEAIAGIDTSRHIMWTIFPYHIR